MRYPVYLLESNVKAITEGLQSVGQKFEELNEEQMIILLEWALGYVDFTNPDIVESMHSHRADRGDTTYEVNFASYNVEAFNRGLEDLGMSIKDFSNEEIGAMLSYVLGYVDFAKDSIVAELCDELKL